MNNLLYLLVIILGFILPFIFSIFINKKNKIFSLEYLFYSYIIFLIVFIIFSKIGYIILEFDLNNLYLFFNSNNIIDKLKFILSGYSFIGGYIGGILSCLLFSKITNKNFKELLLIYAPTLILIYSILKIGCFIKGCCIGYFNIPIQLIESSINLILYLYILLNIKKFHMNKTIGISFIYFGLIRFIISFIRQYNNYFSFVFIEIFCLILIVIGLKILKEKTQK